MRKLPPALAVGVVALLATAARPGFGGGFELLPDVSVRLAAARYVPAETDLHWTGWIGAGAGLFRAGGTTAYFDADVETVLGDTRRAFEATQANYHLELGTRWRLGRAELALVFHHVSRHEVDRPKDEAVDWNVLGLRASARLGGNAAPTRLAVGVGHATLASLVGYRWELTARSDIDLWPGAWGAIGLAADARLVTARSSERFPRRSLLDLRVEAGPRWDRSGRSLALFAAFERRNDVFVAQPGRRDRLLLGFRLTARPGG